MRLKVALLAALLVGCGKPEPEIQIIADQPAIATLKDGTREIQPDLKGVGIQVAVGLYDWQDEPLIWVYARNGATESKTQYRGDQAIRVLRKWLEANYPEGK